MASTCAPCPPLEGSTPGSVECWPGIVAATASNPPPLLVGLSVGDVVTVVFTSPTDTPAMTSDSVRFEPPIGVWEASWRSRTELQIRVVDMGGVDAGLVDVATGALNITVTGLRSASTLSSRSPAISVRVGGTWGAPSPPVILRAVAVDSGANVGLDTGDTLLIVFDQAVAPVDVSNATAVSALFEFSPPLLVSNGIYCSGRWMHNGTTLSLVFAFDTPAAGRLWLPFNVGSLSVRVRVTAGLTSANAESLPSNSSALVSEGSWGDAPEVQVLSASATSLEFTLVPPRTSVNTPVRLYVVQWSVDPGFTGLPSLSVATSRVQAWANGAGRTILPLVASDATASTKADAAGTVTVVLGSNSTMGMAVVALSAAAVARQSIVSFSLPGVTAAVTYHLRCACNSLGDTLSPIVPTLPALVTPQPPLVTTVSILGAHLSTGGGTVIRVVGVQVGGARSIVYLKLSNGAFNFTSPACDIVVPATEVSCMSPPGVGKGHSVAVVVDGVPSAQYLNATLSYAPPVVLSLVARQRTLPGGDTGTSTSSTGDVSTSGDARTSGGSVVVLTGQQFGPAPLSPRSLGSVTYTPSELRLPVGSASGTPVVFTATNCSITHDDVEITCSMSSGVGSRLLWTVVIAGQSSVLPKTAYRPPEIHDIGVLGAPNGLGLGDAVANFSASARAGLVSAGGDVLVFVGDHFGPPGLGIPISALGHRSGASPGSSVTTTRCVVAGSEHEEVHCISPPGVGANYVWTLRVGGQSSGPSTQRTSYAPPMVTALTTSGVGTLDLEPGAVPTSGGATVTLTGRNFGADPTAVTISWNGAPIDVVALRVPHEVVSFTSPSGQGRPASVVVTVGGQEAILLGSSAVGGSALVVPFCTPQVSSVALDRTNGTEPTLDCSAVQADGTSAVGTSSPGRAVLVVQGSNFGTGSDVIVMIRSTPCTMLLGRATHNALTCETSMCNGKKVSLADLCNLHFVASTAHVTRVFVCICMRRARPSDCGWHTFQGRFQLQLPGASPPSRHHPCLTHVWGGGWWYQCHASGQRLCG